MDCVSSEIYVILKPKFSTFAKFETLLQCGLIIKLDTTCHFEEILVPAICSLLIALLQVICLHRNINALNILLLINLNTL